MIKHIEIIHFGKDKKDIKLSAKDLKEIIKKTLIKEKNN